MSHDTLTVAQDERGLLTVTLARPDVRNAFNATLIVELHDVFVGIARGDDIRLVILRGEGSCFCAGADLDWMKSSAALSPADNEADARRMASMFAAIADCPAPVLAVVHGHAMGGGAGLIAAADFALADEDAKIGFTEVRLGIVPAVISPFVLRKIGRGAALRYFTTGEIFTGKTAAAIGLVQGAVPGADLEVAVKATIASVLAAGPKASREAKALVEAVSGLEPGAAADTTAPWIARVRTSPEGQEGMAAFLEKRPAAWTPEADA